MFPMIDCEARVAINDKTLAAVVSAGIDPDGNYLYLKADAKNTLFVRPFTPQMITRWDSPRMRAGVEYNLSGTDVGFWNYGPLGHPGDGEFENRHFMSIEIRIAYTPMKIVISLNGHTNQGIALFKGMPDSHNSSPLPGWRFDVEFSLPRASMKEFFSVGDGYYASFEKRLDQCG